MAVPFHSTGEVVPGLTVPAGGLAACVTAMLKSEAAKVAARMPNELSERGSAFIRWGCGVGSGFDVLNRFVSGGWSGRMRCYSALLVNQPSIARPWLILTLQPC